MKIHEAISMLEQMDPNGDVTITFATKKNPVNSSPPPVFNPSNQWTTRQDTGHNPAWVIDNKLWLNANRMGGEHAVH